MVFLVIYQVRSTPGTNIAYSLLFPIATESHEKCHTTAPISLNLSDLSVFWDYPGNGNMSMGNVAPEFIRYELLQLFGEEHDSMMQCIAVSERRIAVNCPIIHSRYSHK